MSVRLGKAKKPSLMIPGSSGSVYKKGSEVVGIKGLEHLNKVFCLGF